MVVGWSDPHPNPTPQAAYVKEQAKINEQIKRVSSKKHGADDAKAPGKRGELSKAREGSG